ncbi:MAG: hypothetical protein LBG84_00240 [Treponema sp.]|jgi:hypothetical protein|nr:hypothetical protein [Treponema sp.]
MIVWFSLPGGQGEGKTPAPLGKRLFPAVFAAILLSACSRPELSPPSTPLLSRETLGYGVVTASYTRILDEPSLDGVAIGYVRERTILKVLERRLVKEGERPGYWILTEGNYRGWLPESVVKIYDNEGKARTAADR